MVTIAAGEAESGLRIRYDPTAHIAAAASPFGGGMLVFFLGGLFFLSTPHSRLLCFPLSIHEKAALGDSLVGPARFQTETLPISATRLTIPPPAPKDRR